MKKLYICLLILLFSGLADSLTAQPQYYNYNTTGNSNAIPFNYPGGRECQILFLPGDFNQPSPATAGNIESISFLIHPSNPLGPWTYTDFTIKMGQSSITSFAAGAFYSGTLSTVYYRSSVSLTGAGGTWMTIPLDVLFPYDPSQSLIVEIGQCAAPGATGYSWCRSMLSGSRRNNSVGGCPFVYSGQDAVVYHTGITLAPVTQPEYYNYNIAGSGNSYPLNSPAGRECQSLFLPGDFNQPSPAPAGGIESISFLISPTYPIGPWTYTDFTIKMGQSSITSFAAGGFYTGPLTTVYYRSSVTLSGAVGNWMTLPLDAMFPYDPTQSLIIEIGQCAAPGATGFSWCRTQLSGNRRNYSAGGCPFVYSGQDAIVYHTGITLCTDVPVPTITGNNNLCVNSGLYNYTTEPGMTNYTWNVSAGGLISGGTGTNQITVNWTGAGAQTVSVNYTNNCMNQAVTPTFLNVTVNDLPAAAGTIIGPSTVGTGATGVPYTVAPISGAATYIWTLIPGATFASGQWTNNITVNFPSYITSGFMTVLGNNVCGNGPASPGFYVNVITDIAEKDINAPVSIYPNPGDGLFTLQLSSVGQEVYTVQVFNNLGSMISEIKDIAVKGKVERVIDLRSSANGVYSVLIRNSNTWIVKKILLNK